MSPAPNVMPEPHFLYHCHPHIEYRMQISPNLTGYFTKDYSICTLNYRCWLLTSILPRWQSPPPQPPSLCSWFSSIHLSIATQQGLKVQIYSLFSIYACVNFFWDTFTVSLFSFPQYNYCFLKSSKYIKSDIDF